MLKLYRNLFIVICVLIICIIDSSRSLRPVQNKKMLHIICTTTMISDTVRHIAGDCAQIKSLMGPGVDPHLYRPTESDVYALSSADLIFYNGLHLEGKMAEILKQMNSYLPSIAVAEVIPHDFLIESEFEDIYDPHVWHDVSLWMLVADEIKKQLIHHDPDHAVFYEKNADEYMAQLKLLDEYVRILSKKVSIKIMVTAHDAFAYFGKAYGFEVVGLQGISTEAQISTQDIITVTHKIVTHKIPAIFLESSIPVRTVKAVQQAVQSQGWNVAIAPELFSDALGDLNTTADTYHGMITHNIKTIVDSLAK